MELLLSQTSELGISLLPFHSHVLCYYCKGSGTTIKDSAAHKQRKYWGWN